MDEYVKDLFNAVKNVDRKYVKFRAHIKKLGRNHKFA